MDDRITGVMVYYYFVCAESFGTFAMTSTWRMKMRMS